MAEILVDGTATAYRLCDIGYAIDLDRVVELLGAEAGGRSRPARAEAQAFEIRHPPLSVRPGERGIAVAGQPRPARLSAHLFDFGVCSLRIRIVALPASSWSDFTEFGRACSARSRAENRCASAMRSISTADVSINCSMRFSRASRASERFPSSHEKQ